MAGTLLQACMDLALHHLTIARAKWMQDHNGDFDADYYAGLFEDARICLEKVREECTRKEPEES